MMKLWFKYFLLGGLSCWGPELIVAAIGAAMHRLWELPNVILPLSACVAYVLLLRSEKRLPSDPSIAGCMLIGVWRYERNHWILPLRRYTDMVLGDKS